MITFNAEMLANAIEFAEGHGEIFLVEPPMKGLCLISSNGFGDRLIYFDSEGKVVGKKYVLPLELSSRNCARLVKTIRQPFFIDFAKKVKLSFNAIQKSYSYRKARITLSDDSEERFFKILVRHKNEVTFPELSYLHVSENEKNLKLSGFPRRWKFEYLRFTELKSLLNSSSYEELSPNLSGHYLIFSNPYAVLMLSRWFDGYPERKQIDSPLYKLFDLDREANMWEKATLSDFINKFEECHELEVRSDELLVYPEENKLDDYDTNLLFEEYKTLFMEPS